MDHIEKLERARKSLNHVINDTIPLERNDFFLIGLFVQSYCIADLEARRAINLLKQIQTGEPTSYALKLNDKDAIDHFKRQAEQCVWNKELSEGLSKVADIFSMHRHIRHMFAHWSGRRIRGHDAFIFFSANLGGHKMSERGLVFEENDEANMQYGMILIEHIEQEVEKMKGHVQYLANIGRQLEAKVGDIAAQFEEDKRSGKF